MSEEHARFLFMQLLDAVAHCHENGIVHRDIKLSNVLLDGGKCPRVKVCDFGLSKDFFNNECRCCPPAGSPLYMPPEVLKNVVRRVHSQHDPMKSDVWSLGVILFAMLLGRFPFGSQRPAGTGALSRRSCRLSRSWDNFSAGCATPKGPHRSDLRFLLRNMVKAHSADLQHLKSEVWGTCKLSPDCRALLDGLLAMDPSVRLSLADVQHHRWVNGPLFLEHAQTIAGARHEMERRQEDRAGREKSGDPEEARADEELAEIAGMAAEFGCPGDALVRWSPVAERAGRESAGVEDKDLFETPGGLKRRTASI
ncbi:unnamed protein product [Ostreobium quekettii]|uniref:Protein kinase domain-containing protein n=1 Tax=Ostreobium quekettii TaxID=121088 RepID=A0A8S1IPT5_9CHLO|nr:unnamed protein product [Ostreobium quekettii]